MLFHCVLFSFNSIVYSTATVLTLLSYYSTVYNIFKFNELCNFVQIFLKQIFRVF